jgi:hypothetical protein
MPTRTIDRIADVETNCCSGYFKVDRADVLITEDRKYVDVRFCSRTAGDCPPLIIKGDPAAVKALLGLLYNSIQV